MEPIEKEDTNQFLVNIPVTLLTDNFNTVPHPGSKIAAGLDIHATEYVDILPGQSALIKTGISLGDVEIPLGPPFKIHWQVWARSGLSVEQKIEKGAGLIDSDYRGEVKIHLYNNSKAVFNVAPGMRVAQIVPFVGLDMRYTSITATRYANNLEPDTERGESGFGSTGLYTERITHAEPALEELTEQDSESDFEEPTIQELSDAIESEKVEVEIID